MQEEERKQAELEAQHYRQQHPQQQQQQQLPQQQSRQITQQRIPSSSHPPRPTDHYEARSRSKKDKDVFIISFLF